MKKFTSFVAVVSAFFCTNSALACIVPNSSVAAVREIVAQQGGWPMSDAKCELLRKRDLYIAVSSDATVLDGVSVGWIAVRLVDANNVSSDTERTSTYLNAGKASMTVANTLLFNALKDAITGLDFEKAANQIAAYQKAIKTSKEARAK